MFTKLKLIKIFPQYTKKEIVNYLHLNYLHISQDRLNYIHISQDREHKQTNYKTDKHQNRRHTR